MPSGWTLLSDVALANCGGTGRHAIAQMPSVCTEITLSLWSAAGGTPRKSTGKSATPPHPSPPAQVRICATMRFTLSRSWLCGLMLTVADLPLCDAVAMVFLLASLLSPLAPILAQLGQIGTGLTLGKVYNESKLCTMKIVPHEGKRISTEH